MERRLLLEERTEASAVPVPEARGKMTFLSVIISGNLKKREGGWKPEVLTQFIFLI